MPWLLLLLAILACSEEKPTERKTHEAYVWQRLHNDAVREAITTYGPSLDGLVALYAEVHLDDQQIERFQIDPALFRSPKKAGLSIRITAFRGSFEDEQAIQTLERLVRSAEAEGRLSEIQIDFDAGVSQLAGYARWLRRLQTDVPLTITVLPAWMEHPRFPELIAAVDGFVLQVHSFVPPKGPDQLNPLCDQRARSHVRAANRFNKPFRVALPTYAYRLGFDEQGRFLGIAAEGRRTSGTTRRTLRSDPQQIRRLLEAIEDTPHLTGFVWFRLPTKNDRLNWRFETLRAVMDGTPIQPRVSVRTEPSPSGAVDIVVENTGHLDAPLPIVAVRGRTHAQDALQGYETERGLRFVPTTKQLIRPGDRRTIGWLRPAEEVEVYVP